MSGRVVALDIGGTFIKSGVFENGKLGAVMKTPTGAGSLEEIKRSVSEAVEYHLVGGAEGIAASSAGDFDPYRGVCTFATDNLKGYSGFALKAWLEEKYGMRASALNDGHAAMLGEAKSRALKEAAVMLTLISTVEKSCSGKISATGVSDTSSCAITENYAAAGNAAVSKAISARRL